MMNTICIYIDENLDQTSLAALKSDLLNVPHVVNVEMNAKQPHDVTVEFESHYNTPMALLHTIEKKGLHPDIFHC